MPKAPQDLVLKELESVMVHDDTDDEVREMTKESDFRNHADRLAGEQIKLQMMESTIRKKEEQLSRHMGRENDEG